MPANLLNHFRYSAEHQNKRSICLLSPPARSHQPLPKRRIMSKALHAQLFNLKVRSQRRRVKSPAHLRHLAKPRSWKILPSSTLAALESVLAMTRTGLRVRLSNRVLLSHSAAPCPLSPAHPRDSSVSPLRAPFSSRNVPPPLLLLLSSPQNLSSRARRCSGTTRSRSRKRRSRRRS